MRDEDLFEACLEFLKQSVLFQFQPMDARRLLVDEMLVVLSNCYYDVCLKLKNLEEEND